MGNYLTTESNYKDNYKNNNSYLNNLRRWERKIKVNNLKKNYQTNNGPDYMKDLKLWSDQIKIDNFIRNNNTNNPPEYVRNLYLRNQFLEQEFDKMNSDFRGISIV